MTTGFPTTSTCTAQYEAVRAWAVSRPRPAVGPPGAAVLLQRGVVAWLRAWPLWVCHHQQADVSRLPLAPTRPRAGAARALARVLATMVEHCQQEE